MQKVAISKGLQCSCFIRKRISFGPVAQLSALLGLETRAICTISFSASLVQ